MLLIAIPKSASTSLMSTLGRLHNIPAKQIYFPDAPVPKETKFLHKLHGDIRQIDDETVKKFQNAHIIFKQHIFPSPNNIQKLKNIKKVILLRKPKAIIESYFRTQKTRLMSNIASIYEYEDQKSFEDYILKKGILEDLSIFYNQWSSCSENSLIIHYQDLILSPNKVINQIEEFWSLPITNRKIFLDKKRYTRTVPGIVSIMETIKKIKTFLQHRTREGKIKKLLILTLNISIKYCFSNELWDLKKKGFFDLKQFFLRLNQDILRLRKTLYSFRPRKN
ncbi:sulfotransferase domain-containing protein [Candidatus Harpocratesius sp.]